ncbi:hypothetical protein [Spongiibacter marinus]|uniref:hypothetical protein n=1 Tax=Spongiibacter marinus TaxID=354246 RepID=UPI003569EAF2
MDDIQEKTNPNSTSAPTDTQSNSIHVLRRNGPVVPPGFIIADVYDKTHQLISSIHLDRYMNQHQPDASSFPSGSYALIGKINEGLAFTPHIDDAAPISELGLDHSATLAPIHTEEAVEVAKLVTSQWGMQETVTFSRTCQDLVTLTDILDGHILFPPKSEACWGDYIMNRGPESVIDDITGRITANDAISNFMVSDEHVKNISEQHALFKNLIISEHITVICAAPNAGKTTIMNWVASQICTAVDVNYVNIDCSGADLKHYQDQASRYGFKLINFDITGTNREDFFEALDDAPNLQNQLFILDTLKQFVDVMNKASVKGLMHDLRRYCNKGATFVLLAHTNKHNRTDGTPVFEGVGDVKSECDELIYLLPQEQSDGQKVITTQIEKARAEIEPITFKMEKDRTVSLTDHVDVAQKARSDMDEEAIAAITECVANSPANQSQIIDHCKNRGLGKRVTLRTLKRYSTGESALWTTSRGKNNACLYSPNPQEQGMLSDS